MRFIQLDKSKHVRNIVATFLATLLLLQGICFAQDAAIPGNYFTVSGLTGFEDFQDTGAEKFNEGWGMGIRLGRRFNRHFALEGDFGLMSGFETTVDLSNVNPGLSGTDKIALDLWSLAANVKAHYPVGRLDPYVLAGGGIMYSRIRTDSPTGYT